MMWDGMKAARFFSERVNTLTTTPHALLPYVWHYLTGFNTKAKSSIICVFLL